jgi:hypothetical protein
MPSAVDREGEVNQAAGQCNKLSGHRLYWAAVPSVLELIEKLGAAQLRYRHQHDAEFRKAS